MNHLLLEALDKQTSPERLTELASDEDVDVRRAVTENPNTPPELLFALGQVFPTALAKNPALLALAREQPQLVRQIPPPTVRMLLTVDPIPDSVWPLLANHEDVSVQHDVLSSPKAPPSVLAKVARSVPDHRDYRRMTIASNPSAPLAALESLSRHPDRSVRSCVAANPRATPAMLKKLAKDVDECVRGAVAKNPKVPPPLLESLAHDRYYQVNWSVAANPKLSEKSLERLLHVESVGVWVAIASNPSTPTRLLRALLLKEQYNVDAAIARRPDAPLNILRQLSTSRHEEVHDALAENPSVPREILLALPQKRDKRPAAPPKGDLVTLPPDAKPIYTGRNFYVYRIDFEGKPRCLKIPVSGVNLGVFETERVVGGVSTLWNLKFVAGSSPRCVLWASPGEMLESEAQRLKASKGTWNHEAIALVRCSVGGEIVQGLVTPWHEGDLLGALSRQEQRQLFPRMLPSFWTALAAAPHGDLHPSNVILSPDRERFHLIDPGATLFWDQGERMACSSITNLSFVTNADHYPVLPPYYEPAFSLKRGDSLRGHWEQFKWSLTLSKMAPALQTIYPNVMMRAVTPSAGNFLEDRSRQREEPDPSDVLALGIMYFQLLTGESPFPDLTPPAWSQIRTVDDSISGTSAAEKQLDRGITPPRMLKADITEEEERLALALLDLQIPSRERLQTLSYAAAKSAQHV